MTSPPNYWNGCNPRAALWDGRGIYSNGQVDLVWIIAVDRQRLVVDAGYAPTSSASDIGKLTSIVSSLELTGTAEPAPRNRHRSSKHIWA
jgi:hypothetical protein